MKLSTIVILAVVFAIAWYLYVNGLPTLPQVGPLTSQSTAPPPTLPPVSGGSVGLAPPAYSKNYLTVLGARHV